MRLNVHCRTHILKKSEVASTRGDNVLLCGDNMVCPGDIIFSPCFGISLLHRPSRVIFLTLFLAMKQGPKSCPREFINSFSKFGTKLSYISSVQKETFFHVFDGILSLWYLPEP